MVEAGGVSSRALSIFFFCGLWLIGGVKREEEGREVMQLNFFHVAWSVFIFGRLSRKIFFVVVLIPFFVTQEHAHDMLFYTSF